MNEKIVAELAKNLGPIMGSARKLDSEMEINGRLEKKLFDELQEIGFFRSTLSREAGGFEVPLKQVFEMNLNISAASASTGWMTTQFCFHIWRSQLLEEKPFKYLYDRKDPPLIASGFTPGGIVKTSKQGMRLIGQWDYISGLDVSDFVFLNANLDGKKVVVSVPANELVPTKTWQTLHLNATASNRVTAVKQSIDECNFVNYDHEKHKDNPYFSAAWGNIQKIGTLTPILGMSIELRIELEKVLSRNKAHTELVRVYAEFVAELERSIETYFMSIRIIESKEGQVQHPSITLHTAQSAKQMSRYAAKIATLLPTGFHCKRNRIYSLTSGIQLMGSHHLVRHEELIKNYLQSSLFAKTQ